MSRPRRVYGLMRRARPIQTNRHLSALIEGYLSKDGGESRIYGFAKMLPQMEGLEGSEAVEKLTSWWRVRMQENKDKAYHMIFSLHPQIGEEAKNQGIKVDGELSLAVRKSMDEFRSVFFGDDPLTYVAGVHDDRNHPHAHVVLFPYTFSGKRISVSNDYKVAGPDGFTRRNMQAGISSSFNLHAMGLCERMGIGPMQSNSEDQEPHNTSKVRLEQFLATYFWMEDGTLKKSHPNLIAGVNAYDQSGSRINSKSAKVRNRDRRKAASPSLSMVTQHVDRIATMIAEMPREVPKIDYPDSAFDGFRDRGISHEDEIEHLLNERESFKNLAKMLNARRQTNRQNSLRFQALFAMTEEMTGDMLDGGYTPLYERHPSQDAGGSVPMSPKQYMEQIALEEDTIHAIRQNYIHAVSQSEDEDKSRKPMPLMGRKQIGQEIAGIARRRSLESIRLANLPINQEIDSGLGRSREQDTRIEHDL